MRLNAIAYFADFLLCGLAMLALASAVLIRAFGDGHPADLAIWIAAAPAGLLTWTLVEYWVHRYVYHEVPLFRELHDRHHAEPEALIGGPPVLTIAIIFLVGYLPLLPFSASLAGGFTTGALAGYTAYMLVHHAAHHWKSEPGTLLYALRRHHALHHHRDEDGNFGIITSFWDRVFATSVLPIRTSSHRRRA